MDRKISNSFLTVAVILGGVVLITVGILRSDWNYYLTIEQVGKSVSSDSLRPVRVVGEIVPDSWKTGSAVGTFSFILTDGTRRLGVQYTGPAVNVGSGRQIVVEGCLGLDGMFRAGKILTKCESKYTVKGKGD